MFACCLMLTSELHPKTRKFYVSCVCQILRKSTLKPSPIFIGFLRKIEGYQIKQFLVSYEVEQYLVLKSLK